MNVSILPASADEVNPERVIGYVDGYNLYHGLSDKRWTSKLWLNIRKLFELELDDHQELVVVRYFTALGRKQSRESSQRQVTYLNALRTIPGIEVRTEGVFKLRPYKCPHCSKRSKRPQEKRTDVALAIALLHDALEDRFDTAWIMCCDADLIPAVEYIVTYFPEKTVVILPPPGRRSDELIGAAHAKRDIRASKFNAAQLPVEVLSQSGAVLRRPAEWT